MTPDAKYEIVTYLEASNGFGIKIFVCTPPNQTLREEDKDEIQHLSYNLYEKIQGRLHRFHPEEIASAKEERKDILAIFGDRPIFVEEVENEYDKQYGRPWFVVTTSIGRIKIGWRKRVINIDWSATVANARAEDLFKEENTTKGEFSIHAWSYEDAKRYLDVIHSAKPFHT